MSRKDSLRIALVVVFLSAMVWVTRSQTPRVDPASARVSVPQGAHLTDYLQRVSAASGLVTAAEVPSAARTLASPISDKPVSGAVDRLCSTYHLQCRWIDRRLILIRRYVDPCEEPGFEVEALRRVATDVHHLVKQVPHPPLDYSRITNKAEFINSLSVDQATAMRRDSGLRYAELRPDQAKLWQRMSLIKAFGDLEQKWESAEAALSGWPNCRLVQSHDKGGAVRVAFVYPDVPSGQHTAQVNFRIRSRHGSLPQAMTSEILPDGTRQPGESSVPRAFHHTMTGLGRQMKLESLVTELERATGQAVCIPDYARSRQLYLYPAVIPGDEVIMAIQDLYGWKLTEASNGAYELGPDVPKVPVDPSSFFPTAHAVIPPQLHSWWRQETDRSATPREAATWSTLLAEIESRRGVDWHEMRVGDLDERSQRRLAVMVVDRLTRRASVPFLQRTSAPRWLIAPEEGSFRLGREKGQGDTPLLEFCVKRPDGYLDRWGWYVGSGRL